jgi:hypothetical protein
MDERQAIRTTALYWFARYAERASIILDIMNDSFEGLDSNARTIESTAIYREFCGNLGIPDRFGGFPQFLIDYIADEENPYSLHGSLDGAYHNIVLLESDFPVRSISTVVLTAIDRLENCTGRDCRVCELRKVASCLSAVWDRVNAILTDERARNVVVAGRFTERVDLYARFAYPISIQRRAMSILLQHVSLLPDALISGAAFRAMQARKDLARTENPQERLRA